MMGYEKHNDTEWQTVLPRRQNRPGQAKSQAMIANGPSKAKVTSSLVHPSRPPLCPSQSMALEPPPPASVVQPPGSLQSKASNGPKPSSARIDSRPPRPYQYTQYPQNTTDISIDDVLEPADRLQTHTFATGRRDNAAKAHFRRGATPVDAFTMSKRCDQLEPDIAKLYTMLDEIGVRLGSFVRPPQHGNDNRLLIWGDAAEVQATKRELKAWQDFAENREVGYHDKAAREQQSDRRAMKANTRHELDKRIRDDARKMRYQKAPPDGVRFKHYGLFLWPVDEVRPEDLLGGSLEAYDPIRQSAQAHILFEPSLSCFKILSNEDSALALVMKRIQGTMREFVARSEPQDYAIYVVLPTGSRMSDGVYLTALHEGEKPSIPTICGEGLTGQGLTGFEDLRSITHKKNTKSAFSICKRILHRLQYYRGRIILRVEFGCFSLQNWFRWSGTPTPYTHFLDTLGFERTRGVLVKDLRYSQDSDRIVAECIKANQLLEPFESHLKSLEGMKPAYFARYSCRTQVSGQVNLLVEVNNVLGSDEYELTQPTWHDGERTNTQRPMELQFVNITDGISAQFSVCIDDILDPSRITPMMADFAGSIRYRRVLPDHPRVFIQNGAVDVEGVQQKTAYRFRIAGASTWAFELARYDTFAPSAVVPSSTHWAGSLWNLEWDNILAENATLSIGEGANWGPRMDTFFPGQRSDSASGEEGFQGFIDNIQRLMAFLEGLKVNVDGGEQDKLGGSE